MVSLYLFIIIIIIIMYCFPCPIKARVKETTDVILLQFVRNYFGFVGNDGDSGADTVTKVGEGNKLYRNLQKPSSF